MRAHTNRRSPCPIFGAHTNGPNPDVRCHGHTLMAKYSLFGAHTQALARIEHLVGLAGVLPRVACHTTWLNRIVGSTIKKFQNTSRSTITYWSRQGVWRSTLNSWFPLDGEINWPLRLTHICVLFCNTNFVFEVDPRAHLRSLIKCRANESIH